MSIINPDCNVSNLNLFLVMIMYNHHNQLLLKLQSQIPISLQKANILGNVVYNQDKLLVEWAT